MDPKNIPMEMTSEWKASPRRKKEEGYQDKKNHQKNHNSRKKI